MAGGRGSLGDEQKGMRRLWRRRQLAALQRCRKLGCPLGESARKCQDGSFCPPDAAQLVVTSRSCGIKGRRPAAAGHPRGKRVARIMWDEAPLLRLAFTERCDSGYSLPIGIPIYLFHTDISVFCVSK